jgi:hypothetical protein
VDRDAVTKAISDVISAVDYDIWKSYEYPEDEDDPTDFADLADVFISSYNEALPETSEGTD